MSSSRSESRLRPTTRRRRMRRRTYGRGNQSLAARLRHRKGRLAGSRGAQQDSGETRTPQNGTGQAHRMRVAFWIGALGLAWMLLIPTGDGARAEAGKL